MEVSITAVLSTPVCVHGCVCVCVTEGGRERHGKYRAERERETGLAWVGLGRSVQQHLIVNKRGVSSHADQVTAGNKRVI